MADKTLIIKEAQKYLARGQVDKAIAEWEKILKEGPDGNVHNTIGDLHLKRGDKKSAAESYSRAADVFRQDGFALKALALYKKVLNINPAEPGALFALGQLNEEKGLNTDALKYYLASADSLSKEGKKDRLIEIYEKIIALSPSNMPLRNKIAEVYLKEGIKSAAAREYFEIARLYEAKGDLEKAKEYYLKSLDIQPANKEAIIGIGNIYEKSGDTAGAEEHMRQAAMVLNEDVDVLLGYGELACAAGHTEAAKGVLSQIIRLDPDNLRARRLLGEIHVKEGLPEKAWEEYLPVIDALTNEEKYEEAIRLLGRFRAVEPVEIGKRLISLYRQTNENERVADEMARLADELKERGMTEDALGYYKDAHELSPEDARLEELIRELSGKTETEVIAAPAPEGEKTVEEIFIETEIFSRYGLLDEAVKLLEGLRTREPGNIDLHARLKTLYIDMGNKELAVTECLVLSELHRGLGDNTAADRLLDEAAEISPEDPRLVDMGILPQQKHPSFEVSQTIETEEPAEEQLNIEDYEDEIAESDFYVRQGLVVEAAKILERLQKMFPENRNIRERLNGIGQSASETVEFSGSDVEPERPVFEQMPGEELLHEEQIPGQEFSEQKTRRQEQEFSEEQFEQFKMPEEPESSQQPEVSREFEMPLNPEMPEQPEPQQFEMPRQPEEPQQPGIEEQSEPMSYEDLFFDDDELGKDQEMPAPTLDTDVQEVFDEFKKGLEKELGDEDSETHYNLGIAFKEMGLTDDAIKEFQVARNDPARFIQSSTMLGICYMEKGMYPLVIETLTKVIEGLDPGNDSYWPIMFDLADAYDKNNNLQEALDIFSRVYGWNAGFRQVDERIERLKRKVGRKPEVEKSRAKKDRVSYL